MQLLDTTIIVDYIRGDEHALEFLAHSASNIISVMTQAEIYQGARNNEELKNWDKALVNFTVIPITAQTSEKAIELLKKYHLSHGLLIIDSFIAATAIVWNYALVTANLKHFQMMKDLSIIPWSRKS